MSPEQIQTVNQRVSIAATYQANSTINTLCYPAKMIWLKDKNKIEVKFKELGLRHPTTKGRRMIHVFDMSDGHKDYRLEFDAEQLTWTLIHILNIT